MCGIVVSESKKKEVLEAIKKLEKRGPDQTEVFDTEKAYFMFSRLSIMGLDESGMQPFLYKGNASVTNGEIYNYKQIKEQLKDYEFKSGSDCEVLLPLYEKLGVGMFEVLDAEYACVIYDKEIDKLIAARDPIGIRPLFYGYDEGKIIFASEAKAIIELVDKVFTFPPGHYYLDGEFIPYTSITDVEEYVEDSFEAILENIKYKLKQGVKKRLDSDAPMGFLLSGGLDSSLVCSIAQQYLDKPLRTFSIGMEKDPIDLKYAKVVSDYLGTDHTEVIITKEDVLESLEEVIYSLETYDITTIRASMGMYLICKYIRENTDIKVLMTGEISDELFGYKYTDFAPDPESFQAEAKKRIDEIYMYDVLRADRCLASNSLEARVPFGDIDFAKYVMSIHPFFKMNKYKMGKFLLRKAFEGDYLPKDILYRDKAAFSDAVGHSLVDYLKEYAEEQISDEDFMKEVATYKDPAPFTKESLLYRRIFDKYYKDHEHLVKDYWMPNKEWENCDVDDPSARVLSNYGDSGK